MVPVIEGSESGIHVENGAATITNAGTIHGEGGNPGFDAPPDAGITLSGGVSSVTNSGSITGTIFGVNTANRSEEHTSELQSLMRISYAICCLKTKTNKKTRKTQNWKNIRR